ncbi:SMC-Scp complex subunit ScpB [Pseudomonas sp. ZM23]|uniref:SMC-Scp complex subunit ScpB n=1 Tax=Pseudomonas triclosanedens TaxID=2961893 RepID=A0ABY6ZT25_9PSED|nr:SMC-Scp complex subunit ScpB [Pseudomonas triclosanedens]MCP8466555.1 SMC-Scp complex subunit ScpB [Pseudomonas triclosanedens]MCP8472090.1 SMC-Scp complex subunit ScpB [Pseudomonas triclosanedens]MCP8474526.1 SMC-Scp complex subunit ScpB [Pseudomonas triclosanedens]WAI48092.1 SMC-Scp complex subunit ScpB [Pseudomonas triclosanedens]
MNLSDPQELATLLEGILLAAGKPLSLERLGELFEEAERPEPQQFRDALAVLSLSCAGRSFELKEVATGYRLQIREKLAPWVGRLWEERPQRYSRALLETLALIAYRQPITRGEIEEIRGVAVNTQIVKTLMEREWIRIVGYREVPGRPAMLATTRTFLDYFNLKSLEELPPLAELKLMEPEPQPILEDMAPVSRIPGPEEYDEDYVPPSLQALADQALRDAGEEPEPAPPEEKPEETSFRSLLAELDEMESGLKTDFDDLIDLPPADDEDSGVDADFSGVFGLPEVPPEEPVIQPEASEPPAPAAAEAEEAWDEERALAEAMREEMESIARERDH